MRANVKKLKEQTPNHSKLGIEYLPLDARNTTEITRFLTLVNSEAPGALSNCFLENAEAPLR